MITQEEINKINSELLLKCTHCDGKIEFYIKKTDKKESLHIRHIANTTCLTRISNRDMKCDSIEHGKQLWEVALNNVDLLNCPYCGEDFEFYISKNEKAPLCIRHLPEAGINCPVRYDQYCDDFEQGKKWCNMRHK